MAELIYKGLVYGCVLSDEAVEQIGFDGENLPERICGEDSEELWVRIIRYCDGEKLIEPFELNHEGDPFWAVKTARPESLRAYFGMTETIWSSAISSKKTLKNLPVKTILKCA